MVLGSAIFCRKMKFPTMECGMESGLCYTLVQLVTPSVQEFGEIASEVRNTKVVPDVIDQ